jgi:hypothetical protein
MDIRVDLLELLLKLRTVVTRLGEGDRWGWWATQGLLGPTGEIAFKRGFPRTHFFAQAKAAITMARQRCQESFAHSETDLTLFHLPGPWEDAFENRWSHWVQHGSVWDPFFRQVQGLGKVSVAEALTSLKLATADQAKSLAGPTAEKDQASLRLPKAFNGKKESLLQLALGFAACGDKSLVVPFAEAA